MSQPSGQEPGPRSGANLLWAILFVAAAVVGGLAAAAITHASTTVAVVYSVIVGLIAVAVQYRGLLDQAPAALARHAGGHELPGPRPPDSGTVPAPPWSGTGAGQRPGTAIAPPGQQDLVRLVEAGSGNGGAWWEQRVTSAPAGQTVAAGSAPKADISEYLDQALIAQCPNCGSFRIDVDSQAAPWRFGCQECGKSWNWQPGHPWPAIHVRPNVRRRTNS